MAPSGPVEFLSRPERSRRFAFDCPSLIYFKDWVPGGEYVQKIVLKNTGKKLQQIKYVLPESKYFSMAFPDPIRLAAGNAIHVDVVFRPVIYEPYDDVIEFICPTGNFFVRVVATVKQLVVALPDMLDFNFCAVNELATREIEIHNIGELDAHFNWRLTGPFTLSPMTGVIQPDKFQTVTISFHPQEANVFVARAMLDVTDPSGKHSQVKEFRCSAIAKFPHLVTSEHQMDFGEVLTDQRSEKTFFLKNDSLVDAVFKVNPQEDDVDPVFFFSPMHGVIEPEGDCKMKIRYNAGASDTYSASNFTITTAGGNVLEMRCTGRAIGPTVKLSQTSINFGDLHLGHTKVDGTRDPPTYSRSFQIINGSDINVEFTFVASPDGMFAFSRTSGMVKARSYENIIVSFTPRYDAFNFYKRVTCLIKNQGSLFLDLLCTAVDPDDKRRPAQLTQKHVHQYHRFLQAGITRVAVAEAEAAADAVEMGITPTQKGALRPNHPESFTIFDKPNYHQQMHAFFLADDDRRRDVSLDCHALDFSGVISGNVVTKQIRVFNRLGGKILVNWMKPPEGGDLPPAFTIYPEQQDILSNSSEEFTVTFKPSVSNEYFSETLECVTFLKTTRTFRLVNEKTFISPISLALNVAGHTVPPTAEHFIPKCTFNKERINFPGVLVGGSRFQTIKLTNHATTPLQYTFDPDKSGTFTVKPSHGTVRPKTFCLIACRFSPRASRLYEHIQKVKLNFAHSEQLELIGSGYQPDIDFGKETDGLYLRPTCMGAISQKKLYVRNTTRIAVHYKWHVPERLERVLVIDKPDRIIQPNNTECITWTFAPTKAKLYFESLDCDIFPCDSEITGERQTMVSADTRVLDVIGDGAMSGVSFEESNLDFGAVLVNNKVDHEFYLVNKSTCNITYKLSFDQTLKLTEDPSEPESGELQTDIPPITYDIPTGHLRARSRKKIIATFAPLLRRFYSFNTYCHAVPDPIPEQGDDKFDVLEPALDRPVGPLLCEMPMAGVSTYPAIAFADVRKMGMNPYRAWQELGLDEINAALASEPGDFESNLNRAEGLVGGGGYTGIIDALTTYHMHFPPMVRKSPPLTMTFKLENQGHLMVDWSITYPTEKQVEVELWAEAEEPGPRELRWMDIVTKKLFTVEPRKGQLKPGEMQVLTITYQYTHVDEPWELPVILQAKKGRRIVLNLIGRTLDPSTKVLNFAHRPFTEAIHMMQPVMIGEQNPAVQTMELQNPGVTALEYEIETKACDDIQAQNYGFRIFECENPRGGVMARGVTKVRWIFHPLEAKLYEMKLKVQIVGGGCYDLTIRGQGFHPQAMVGNEIHFRNHLSTFPRLPGFHWWWQTTRGSKSDCLVIPKQVGVLNPDFISFGHVPLHSITHRLVMVRNIAPGPVTFTWDDTNELLQGEGFGVAPMEGRLEPGEHVMCKITYHPVLRPELIESEIFCTVQPEEPPEDSDEDFGAEEEKKAKELAAAKAKAEEEAKGQGHLTLMERQQYAETRSGVPSFYERSLPPGFADDSPTQGSQQGTVTGLMGEGSMMGSSAAGSTMQKGSMRSGAGSTKGGGTKKGSLASGSRRGSMTNASQHNQGLQPIQEDDSTYRLYINLQAFAYTSDSYRQLHPKCSNFMISKATDAYPSIDVPKEKGHAKSTPAVVIRQSMVSLLKEVILDMDIKSSFSTVDDKPTPYFCQFSTAPPSAATLKAAAAMEKVKMRMEAADKLKEEEEAAAAAEAAAAEEEAIRLGQMTERSDAMMSIASSKADDAAAAPEEEEAPEEERPETAGTEVEGRNSRWGKTNASLTSLASATSEAMALAKGEAILRRNIKLAQAKAEQDALRKLHRDEDFYYLASRVLENTMANLSVEASYGEFDTTRPPRQIVQAVGDIDGHLDGTPGDTLLDTDTRAQIAKDPVLP